MNKAILVLEMPPVCDECVLCILDAENDEWVCCFGWSEVSCDSKPDWCPLLPLPERRLIWHDDERDDYELGWNACLKEIEGSEHE